MTSPQKYFRRSVTITRVPSSSYGAKKHSLLLCPSLAVPPESVAPILPRAQRNEGSLVHGLSAKRMHFSKQMELARSTGSSDSTQSVPVRGQFTLTDLQNLRLRWAEALIDTPVMAHTQGEAVRYVDWDRIIRPFIGNHDRVNDPYPPRPLTNNEECGTMGILTPKPEPVTWRFTRKAFVNCCGINIVTEVKDFKDVPDDDEKFGTAYLGKVGAYVMSVPLTREDYKTEIARLKKEGFRRFTDTATHTLLFAYHPKTTEFFKKQAAKAVKAAAKETTT